MKKIVATLLSCVLGITLFVGCSSNNKDKDENIIKASGSEVVSGGAFYNEITSVYKDVDVEYTSEDDKIDGEKNLLINISLGENKNLNDLSREFNEISKKIFEKIQPTASKYENLNNINFHAIVNNKKNENADILCLRSISKDNKIYYEFGSETEAKDFKEKTQKEKDEEIKAAQKAADDAEKQVEEEKRNRIAVVPDEEGYFKAPKLLDNIEEGNSRLSKNKSSFKVENENGKKIVKVNLIYENKVLVVGIVNNIRNNIESAFKDQCDEIDLSITQEHPMDVYECKYIDGSWDKEVK